MRTINSIKSRASELASSPENCAKVISLLIDSIKADYNISYEDALGNYVHLKLVLHRLKKASHFDWMEQHKYAIDRLPELRRKVAELRAIKNTLKPDKNLRHINQQFEKRFRRVVIESEIHGNRCRYDDGVFG